jgi:hypothetical protein
VKHYSPSTSRFSKWLVPLRFSTILNAVILSYFDVVVGLARSYDPESYANGSVGAGRVSHAGQVKGDDPDKRDTPALQVGDWPWS